MFKSHSARRIISIFLVLSFFCTTFFVTLIPVKKVNAATGVEYRIKNRFTGEYMNEEKNDGKVQYGALNTDLDSMKWVLEDAANDGTGSTRIRNVSTGHYLGIEHVYGYVEADTLNPAALSMMWYLKDAGDGCVRLQCVWQDHRDYMHVENKKGYVESGAVPEAWLSAQWVLEAVSTTAGFTISPTKVVDNNRGVEANVISPTQITSNYYNINKTWTQSEDTSSLPQFKAESYPILQALYNMSLEDALKDIRPEDGAFKAGASWPGVWTRDVSYSSQLALSWILPDNAKNSLMAKTYTNPDEIIQDTGTGGSWPVSTDRVVWGIAAWEYYLSTGDTAWLNRAYESLNATVQKDQHVAFDSNIGLFNGETSLMDWRNQTYPDWFSDLPGKTGNTYENRYIAESKALSTNVLYSQIYSILGQMGTVLGKPSTEINNWNSKSSDLKTTINNKFWMGDKGYYGLFLYPRSVGYALSQKSDALGLGLSMYYGVADSSKSVSITESYPVVDYGVPTIYPEKPDRGPYHNKSIWPVVEAYYMLGAKKAGNTEAVEHTMKSFIRASALFLTNKENYVYDTGNSYGTAVNSSSMLWSAAGYLSMVYRVIMGMNYTTEGIEFNPMVPDSLIGPFDLSNFKYRDSTLNIKVIGNGDQIDSLMLDGVAQALPYVYPANGTGNHTIEITLKKSGSNHSINKVQAGVACEEPSEPIMSWTDDGKLQWTEEPGYSYKLWDGKSYVDATSPYTVENVYSTYNLVKISNSTGIWSDLGGVLMKIPDGSSTIYEAEDGTYNPGHFDSNHAHSGTGFVTDANGTADLSITVDIPAGQSGNYILRYWYANSNSDDGNFCGIRSMLIDGVDSATVVFPNLSNGNWDIYNYSSYVFANLTEGKHTIKLIMSPDNYDQNMSRSKNDMNVDYLELIKQGSSDATLKDLQVDGKTITGFSANTDTYEIELPTGTTTAPAISATVNDLNANAVVTQAAAFPGSATILVTAQDGFTTKTYTVNFIDKPKGTDATLKDLQVDGNTVIGFAADTTTYEVILASGTTTAPAISATVNDLNASAVVTQADALPGTATILVTAEDGITTETYNVNFTLKPKGTDATLRDLQVDGKTVVGFTANTTTYEVILASGTTTAPAISATVNDSNASVLVTQAAALPGSATVVVTAEDGVTTMTYKVNFTVKPSTDATLKDLQVGGKTVTGFAANTTTYAVELPAGTTSAPAVIATVNDSNANTAVTQATVLPGTATILVTAEDGVTIMTYKVNFTVAVASSGGNSGNSGNGGSSGGTTPSNGGTTPNNGGTTPNNGGTTPSNGGTTPSTTNTPPFVDMDKHQWAAEAVEALHTAGIISGTSATTFNPGKNISRADFMLLLVKALKLNVDTTDNFSDISKDAYYYKAIAIAKKLGITSGTGNNKFDPKAEISRQDMMVLVVKALNIVGVNLETGSAEDLAKYSDSSKIFGYAQEAVATLVKEGIIQGSGNNLNPKADLTRAEAAIVIYKIYKK